MRVVKAREDSANTNPDVFHEMTVQEIHTFCTFRKEFKKQNASLIVREKFCLSVCVAIVSHHEEGEWRSNSFFRKETLKSEGGATLSI